MEDLDEFQMDSISPKPFRNDSFTAEDALIAARQAKEDEDLRHLHIGQQHPAPRAINSVSVYGSKVCPLSQQVFVHPIIY
jgi:hypothetical protein